MKRANNRLYGRLFMLLASSTLLANCNAILGIQPIDADGGNLTGEPDDFKGAASGAGLAVNAASTGTLGGMGGGGMSGSLSGGGMSSHVSGSTTGMGGSAGGFPTSTSMTSTGMGGPSSGPTSTSVTSTGMGGNAGGFPTSTSMTSTGTTGGGGGDGGIPVPDGPVEADAKDELVLHQEEASTEFEASMP